MTSLTYIRSYKLMDSKKIIQIQLLKLEIWNDEEGVIDENKYKSYCDYFILKQNILKYIFKIDESEEIKARPILMT